MHLRRHDYVVVEDGLVGEEIEYFDSAAPAISIGYIPPSATEEQGRVHHVEPSVGPSPDCRPRVTTQRGDACAARLSDESPSRAARPIFCPERLGAERGDVERRLG